MKLQTINLFQLNITQFYPTEGISQIIVQLSQSQILSSLIMQQNLILILHYKLLQTKSYSSSHIKPLPYYHNLMGNQDSKQTSNSTSQGQGVWFQYLAQIQSSQKSEITPFYKVQISYLQKLFRQLDKSNTKSLQLSDLKNLPFLTNHSFKQRIMTLFEEQLAKIKTRKISLQIFLHLLSTFHINTDIEQKAKFLFRVYDWDKDFRINHSDLVLTFRVLFRDKILFDRLMDEQSIKNMASQALLKYGTRGEIKLQQFLQLVPHDQIKEVMTFKYSKNYQ